jgi:FkbM family methyltransferase
MWRKRVIRFLKPIGERYPGAARSLRRWRDDRRLRRVVQESPAGFRFVGEPEMEDGSYELEETRTVQHVLDHVDVFINVGANSGYYCCHALQKGRNAIAFEPLYDNLRYLYKNIMANGWEDEIEVFPLALSDQTGIVQIYGGGPVASLLPGWAATPGQYVEAVPASTLDTVLGDRFLGRRCLVLVDVEGAERRVLEGGRALLAADPKPFWMVEILVSELQPGGVTVNPNLLATFGIFWQMGYEAWTAESVPRAVYRDEVEAVATTGRDTFGGHVFLFVEPGRMAELYGSQ